MCSENVEEEELQMKATEKDLRQMFQTTVNLCVHNGHMTPERACSYYRSGEILYILFTCVLKCLFNLLSNIF